MTSATFGWKIIAENQRDVSLLQVFVKATAIFMDFFCFFFSVFLFFFPRMSFQLPVYLSLKQFKPSFRLLLLYFIHLFLKGISNRRG